MSSKGPVLELGKVLTGELAGQELAFDLNLLRSGRCLIQASSGAGKSETIKKIATLTIPLIPNVIVDPEGEYSGLRSQLPFLLVGPGGEVPAALETVDEVVKLILETGVSAIFDLFELGQTKYEYARRLFEAFDQAPKTLWRDLLIVVDEAHVFAPQDAKLKRPSSEAFANLASRGRKRGYAIIPATQRLALLDNNVAALCENMLFGRTGPIDQGRSAEMLGISGKAAKEFGREIGRVNDGDFYAWGRAFGVKEPTLFHVERVPGPTLAKAAKARQRTAPPTPESIRELLPKFEALPQVVEKKVVTEKTLRADLDAAQRRIRELERAAPKSTVGKGTPAPPAGPQIDKETMRMLVKKLETLSEGLNEATRLASGREQRDARVLELVDELRKLMVTTAPMGKHLAKATEARQGAADILASITTTATKPAAGAPSIPTQQHAAVRPREAGATGSGGRLSGVALKIAGVAVGYALRGEGISKKLLATLCGVTMGGSFSSRLSEARTDGAIRTEGNTVWATSEGVAKYRGEFAVPETTEEVLALWRPRLGGVALQILDHLVSLGGDSITRAKLAEAVGVSIGGSFSSRLSEVRSTGLLVEDGGNVAVNRELLFL